MGHALPRWGIVGPAPEPLRAPRLLLLEHVFDLNQTAELMRKGVLPSVVIAGWGMRLSYYRPPDAYRTLFPVLGQGYRAGEDELVIHVRGDDILDLHHPRYCPLPFSFYERVIEVSGLRPLFMGQIGDDAYSAALRSRFPGAAILPRQSVVDDFDTIRTARHVVLSASSFAWLAAWLSETVRTIHLPVFHLLDPRDGQTFLLPLEDPRYRFYAIQELVADETGAVDLVAWATQARSAGPPRPRAAGRAGRLPGARPAVADLHGPVGDHRRSGAERHPDLARARLGPLAPPPVTPGPSAGRGLGDAAATARRRLASRCGRRQAAAAKAAGPRPLARSEPRKEPRA